MKKLNIHFTKKKVLILVLIAIIILGALVATAFWLKTTAETGATKSIEKSREDVSKALKTLDSKVGDTKLTSQDRLSAFGQLTQTLANLKDDTCKAETKNIMFNLSNAKDRCSDARKKIEAIQTAANEIQTSVKNDQTLSQSLKPIQSADATNAAKQLEAWTAVTSGLAKAEVSKDATVLKERLVTVATNLKTVWQELIEADKTQNKASYEAAKKKIGAAKDDLTKIAEEQTTAFKAKLANFKKAVSSFK